MRGQVTAQRFVQACEQIVLRQKRADLVQAVQQANSGDLEATRRAFDEVIRNDPNNADAYVRRGIVEANANELGKAAGYFKKAISLAPDEPTPYLNLAQVYVSAGQIDDEVRVYDDMVRRLPEWRQGHAFAARADARRRKGDAKVTPPAPRAIWTKVAVAATLFVRRRDNASLVGIPSRLIAA